MTQEQKDQQLKDLKAQAYDALVQLENWQRVLKSLNQQINDWKEPEKPKKE